MFIICLSQVYGEDADPSTAKLTFNVTNAEYSNLFWFVDNEVHVAREDNRRVDNVIQVGGVDAEKVPAVIQLDISLTDDKYTVFTMVNVTVIDINDNTPYFINTPPIANIPDTASAGRSVLTVSAKDEDRTYNDLTFMLIDDFGAFAINHTTGLISVSKYASFNVTAVSFYNLTVVVQDSGSPPKTNTTDIMIVLNETNAGPPLFIKTVYKFNFTENDITESAKIEATDDEGVTYSIISGNMDHIFKLNSTTGVMHLVNGSLNFEDQPVYSFIVLATDKAVFPKSSTVSVTINVIDVNEEPTIIIDTKTVFKQINSSKGEILKVKSLDPDKKPEYRNLTYSLQEMGSNYFGIDSKTGVLYINKTLDKAGNYSLNVTVTDGGNLSNRDSVLVIVSNITGYVLNTLIQENRPVNTEVYNLVNITLEQPSLTFELENGVGNFYLKNVSNCYQISLFK